MLKPTPSTKKPDLAKTIGPTLKYFYSTYSKSNRLDHTDISSHNEELIAKFLTKIKQRVDMGHSAPGEDAGMYVDKKPVGEKILEQRRRKTAEELAKKHLLRVKKGLTVFPIEFLHEHLLRIDLR